MGVQVFIHIANLLFLSSYLVKDIFLLRILTLIAGFSLLPYYFWVEGGPLTSSIFWSFVFSSVNLYQLYQLYHERKPIRLSKEQQQVYQSLYSYFSVLQFSKLWQIGAINTVAENQFVLEEGCYPNQIILLLEGSLSKSSQAFCTGNLIGAIDFITQQRTQQAVQTEETCKLMTWQRKDLDMLFKKDKGLYSSWQSMLSNALAKQLAS